MVTALIFLVLRPKPIVAFWSIFCIGFWHITLFSQPRGTPPLISDAFATFFPALFVAYAYWRAAWRFTLPAFRKAPIEATVWYLGSFWPGVLTNKISEHIPIDRLIASDIAARPGALTAVIVIAVVLIVILINQLRVIRKTGWLPFYLGWYVVAALVATVMALLPGLQFRLHHYILATALIAGTGIPTRLSAIYQGFLTGMFLNGIAAYGFDSILQTADEASVSFVLLALPPARLPRLIIFFYLSCLHSFAAMPRWGRRCPSSPRPRRRTTPRSRSRSRWCVGTPSTTPPPGTGSRCSWTTSNGTRGPRSISLSRRSRRAYRISSGWL